MAIEKLPSTGDAPRSTGVPASLVPGGAADSAGYPWAGRTFEHHETAFAGDDGSTPIELAAAVRALREAAAAVRARVQIQGRGSSPAPETFEALAETHADALLALSGSRVLIPLLAEAGEFGVTPEGRTVEKTQELSIVTIAAPDGRRAMPVFSSVASMQAWNPEARPIPVPAPQAALAAAQEGTDLLIVDPGSPECELGVRRTELEAVALARRSVPSWADGGVLAAFQESALGQPLVRSIALVPADPEARLLAPQTEVVLTLQPGLDREALNALLGSLQQLWAASEAIAERVDSLRLALR